jgi:hypothetical protein
LAQKFEQMISIRDKIDQVELVVSVPVSLRCLLTDRAGTITENHHTSAQLEEICQVMSDTTSMTNVSLPFHRLLFADLQSHTKISSR